MLLSDMFRTYDLWFVLYCIITVWTQELLENNCLKECLTATFHAYKELQNYRKIVLKNFQYDRNYTILKNNYRTMVITFQRNWLYKPNT
jgi:hypothetical protein